MDNGSRRIATLIGRDDELALARDLLSSSRLLTLTGPGGSGKTRLALALIEEARSEFADGATFVPLASVRDLAVVSASIATALGVTPAADRAVIESVASHLMNRHMLLALDNFEQVIDAASDVATLLDRCPRVTILVTSRVSLRLRSEQTLPVPPLRQPDVSEHLEVERLAIVPAVRLFVERARAIDPSFALTADNAAAVSAICRRLDGLPLAIELAAARTRLLNPRAINERLDHALSILTGGPRDAPQRQQTVRDAIAWSYDLLTTDEQRLLRQLSVFAGGWTLETAEAVSDAELDALTGLDSLIDHSLVQRVERPDGTQRFVMLAIIREYSQERLEASGEDADTRDRHAWSFLDTLIRLQDSLETNEPDPVAWAKSEADNIRAALEWSLAPGQKDARLVDAGLHATMVLMFYWRSQGHFAEGRAWLARALARTDVSDDARGTALNAAGHLAAEQGDFALAVAFHEEALAIGGDARDDRLLSWTWWGLGRAAMWQGDFDRATAAHEQGIALARRNSNNAWLQLFLGNQGSSLIASGDLDAAEAVLAEAQDAFRAAYGASSANVSIRLDQGLVALYRGNVTEARALFESGLTRERDEGPSRFVAMGLESFAWLAATTRQPQRAAVLLGAASALRDEIGTPVPPAYRSRHAMFLQKATVQLDAASWSAAWDAGHAMPLDDAIDLALGTGTAPESESAASPSSILSKREQDVLRLLVDGQSNQEIAAALHISPNTVANHVASIMNKLGVDSRTAAATWAVRHGIDRSSSITS